MITRRRSLQLAAGALVFPGPALAQAWPQKNITAVVPFTAGGASDIVARIICERLADQLGQTIVIENRGGAGGTLGAASVATKAADGYTLLVHSVSHTIAAVVYKSLSFDPINAFAGVACLGIMANVLVVSPSRGFKTLSDLVAAAKSSSLTFGSAGIGTVNHITAERLSMSAGFKGVHIPYKGAPEALQDLVGGRIDFFFSPYLPAKAFIDNGQLIALAVASDTRAKALPDVPTTVEQGFPDTEFPYWNGLFVRSETPPEIVDRLNRETIKAVDAADAELSATGNERLDLTPEEFNDMVRKQIMTNIEVARAAGIEPQ